MAFAFGMGAKNSMASSTVWASASAMDFPLHAMSRVSLL